MEIMRSMNQEAKVPMGYLQGDQVTQDDRRTWGGGENYQPGTKVTNKGRVSSLNSVFLANHFVSLSLSVLMCK